ncbi:hypothetical protein J6590_067997 [Homalodisca vitripennis]|nr:hypothetical protein J6590_067997 [Homalodisca vitripennis]
MQARPTTRSARSEAYKPSWVIQPRLYEEGAEEIGRIRNHTKQNAHDQIRNEIGVRQIAGNFCAALSAGNTLNCKPSPLGQKYRMQSPSDNDRLGGLTQGYTNDDHTNPPLSVRSTVCRVPPIMNGLAG